jgi:hypothetical protein
MKLTIVAEIEHTEDVVVEKITEFPDGPPVALTK